MPMFVVLAAATTFVSTLSGGLFALRFRRHLHLMLGLTAGVLIGVVAFDLLPEIFRTAAEGHFDPTTAMIALVGGFFGFHIIEKLTILHSAHEDNYADHKHPAVGIVSALALSGHSFLDGVGIGLAFQVDAKVGLAVALAIVAHDFYDGLNTVNLMLLNKNTAKRALQFLFLDAIAPVLGAISTLAFHLTSFQLLIYLGVFAGFLLYIGAAEILPEAHAKKPSRLGLVLSLVGAAFMFAITRVSI